MKSFRSILEAKSYDKRQEMSKAMNAVSHETWADYNIKINDGTMKPHEAYHHFVKNSNLPDTPSRETFYRKLDDPSPRTVRERLSGKLTPKRDYEALKRIGETVKSLYLDKGLDPKDIKNHLAKNNIRLTNGQIAGHINRRVPKGLLRNKNVSKI